MFKHAGKTGPELRAYLEGVAKASRMRVRLTVDETDANAVVAEREP